MTSNLKLWSSAQTLQKTSPIRWFELSGGGWKVLPAGSRTGEMTTLGILYTPRNPGFWEGMEVPQASLVSERLVTSSLIWEVSKSQDSQRGLHSAPGPPASWSGPSP